jgi:hypothetical protein
VEISCAGRQQSAHVGDDVYEFPSFQNTQICSYVSASLFFVKKIDIHDICAEPPYTILPQKTSARHDVLRSFFLPKDAFIHAWLQSHPLSQFIGGRWHVRNLSARSDNKFYTLGPMFSRTPLFQTSVILHDVRKALRCPELSVEHWNVFGSFYSSKMLPVWAMCGTTFALF